MQNIYRNELKILICAILGFVDCIVVLIYASYIKLEHNVSFFFFFF